MSCAQGEQLPSLHRTEGLPTMRNFQCSNWKAGEVLGKPGCVGHPTHGQTFCPYEGPVSMLGVAFQKVHNSPLKVTRLCLRTPGGYLIVLPLGFAIHFLRDPPGYSYSMCQGPRFHSRGPDLGFTDLSPWLSHSDVKSWAWASAGCALRLEMMRASLPAAKRLPSPT